jgi:hypothetical protein
MKYKVYSDPVFQRYSVAVREDGRMTCTMHQDEKMFRRYEQKYFWVTANWPVGEFLFEGECED